MTDSSGQDSLERYREQRRKRMARRPEAPADFRAANEDDDGYDPYSDFMDAQARRTDEEPCEDPWR
jgi:hypothetical protein